MQDTEVRGVTFGRDNFQRQSRWVVWLIGFGLLTTLAITVLLGRQVVSDLEQQRSAGSDNVQWTLTQVEVEYLSFLNALEHHGHASESPDFAIETFDLEEVRTEFDVFFSRVDTLDTSQLFSGLRGEPGFARPLARIGAFLDGAVPLIDGSDATLAAGIDDLWRDAVSLKETVRQLSVSGLAYFARLSDHRRVETAATLTRLAAFSGGLFLALAGLSVYLLVVNRTIRHSSAELAQANQRMNTILSTSLDAVIVVNAAGEVLQFNPAAEAIFGRTQDQAMGRSIGDLIVPQHLRAAHQEGMERMQRGGDRHVVGKGRVQLEAMRANGEIFPVELALQSAHNGEEEIVIGFIRDISRRVANEEELIAARDRALAGQKAKDDFLTVMSHEIRTPLNGILGNLSLLKGSRLSQEQRQFTRNMEISGDVLLNHVNAVLDIARFEAGKLNLVQEPENLGTLLQELVDSQSGSASERGNSIEWQWVGAPKPWVLTDGQRLRQILLNLVGNAIKFTRNGRISIEVEVGPPEDGTQAAVYEFRVIDTGIGISQDDTDRIFEDFHTQDASLGRTAGGTGLGLGIARRLAQAMDGEIGVESEPGEGSVFWVRLGLPECDPTAVSSAPRGRGVQDRSLDLLVVEDNDINLQVIRAILERQGHRVSVARDGKSGVDAAAARRFDAILMDISMPVMDGLTATRHIRSSAGKSADVPIIAVSANVLPDAVQTFEAAGMDAFVGKPISVHDISDALSRVTGGRALRAQATPRATHLDEMRADLGAETFERLLTRFVAETDALMQRLFAPDWPDGDHHALRKECHRIAGSAAMFGALGMRDALIAIEIAPEATDIETLRDLASKARDTWNAEQRGLPAAR